MSYIPFDNSVTNSKDYISKSKITRKELDKMSIPQYITVEEAKKCFDECQGRFVVTGNENNVYQQRHTKIVHRLALYKQIIKGQGRWSKK